VFWAEKHSEKLGGPERAVEINEEKVGKRKYNRGRFVKGHRIFGGYERESKIFHSSRGLNGGDTPGVHKGVDIARDHHRVRLLEVL